MAAQWIQGLLQGVRYERLPVQERAKKTDALHSELVELSQDASKHGALGHANESYKTETSLQLSVHGMTCTACSTAVEKILKALPGISRVGVSLMQNQAEVDFDASQLKPEAIVEAIEDAGFDAAILSLQEQEQPQQAQAQPAQPREDVVELRVSGMTCAACSSAVEKALLRVPGVRTAVVALLAGTAEAKFDPGQAAVSDLLTAVDDAGFDVELIAHHPHQDPTPLPLSTPCGDGAADYAIHASCGVGGAAGGSGRCQAAAPAAPQRRSRPPETLALRVSGMTCSACSSSIEQALRGTKGVVRVVVNLVTGSAEVQYDGGVVGPRDVVAAVHDCGFGAEVVSPDELQGAEHGRARQRELDRWWFLFTSSLYFTIPVFFAAMVLPRMPGSDTITQAMIFGFPCNELVKWVLTTPVQFVVGWCFHRGAWNALRRGAANMDVLVSLGTNASYLYSVISILHHHFNRHHMTHSYRPTDFFETCAVLITLICLGKYLECAAKGKTSEALTKLLKLVPEKATLVRLDAAGAVVSTEEVSSLLIHKGDLLKVLPGAKVPADGVVLDGQSYVNESMVTGESAAVWKSRGDVVIGGTISTSGALIMKATRVGSETTLSQIVRLVEHAQSSKTRVQAFADRVSAVFVPAVISLALITWLAWFIAGVTNAYPDSWLPAGHTHFLFALLFGIAVVVISCPCALGLATPTAVMVGTGVAAAQGILIKGGDALERASHVDVVVFDKTGTVTLGRPTVTQCHLVVPGTDAATAAGQQQRFVEAQQLLQQRTAAASTPLVPPQALALLVGAAEQESQHPLARALLAWCGQQLPDQYPAAGHAAGGSAGGALGEGLAPGGTGGASSAAFPPAAAVRVIPGLGVVCGVRVGDVPGISQALLARSSGAGGKGAAAGSTGGGQQRSSSDGLVQVVVGNLALMQQEGVSLPPPEVRDTVLQPAESSGHSCVHVAVGNRLAAVMCVADPLKPEAPGVVAELRARGIECWLVTGDNWRTGRAVAARLGVDHVRAEVLPSGKAEQVKELQAAGRVVAMVGDGVNDSPALAAADVGVAIGSGTDIAIEAAAYVLMRDDLEDVLAALDISRKTFNRIRLNYVWAMGYNVLMIPLAAGVLYPAFKIQMPPWVAGFCMAFSSLSVVLSSLHLRRYKRPPPVMRGVAAHGGDEHGDGDHEGKQEAAEAGGVAVAAAAAAAVGGGLLRSVGISGGGQRGGYKAGSAGGGSGKPPAGSSGGSAQLGRYVALSAGGVHASSGGNGGGSMGGASSRRRRESDGMGASAGETTRLLAGEL